MLRAIFYFQRFSEFLKEFALAFIEPSWSLYAHLYKEIAIAASIEDGDALILDAERGAGLGPFGNFQHVLATQGGNLEFRAQRRLHDGNRHRAVQVRAFALEERMLLDVEDDVKIAGLPAEGARFAEAIEADAGAILDTGGNFGFDGTLAEDSSLPFALGTRIGDDLT